MSEGAEGPEWTEDDHDAALTRHNKLFCKSSKSFNQVYDFYPKDAITFREAHDTVLMVPTATSFVPGAIAETDVRKKIARKRIQLIKDEEAAFDDQVDDQNLRYEFFHVSMAEPVRISSFRTVYPARLITNTMLVRRQVAVAIRSYGDYQKFSRLLFNWINVKQWYDLRVANLDYVPPLFGDYVHRRQNAIESFLKVLILNRVVFQIPLFHLFLYTNKSMREIEACMQRFNPDVIATEMQEYERQYFPRPLSQREIFAYSELAKEREAEMAYDAGSDEAEHFWTPETPADFVEEKRNSISDDGSSCTDEDAHRLLVSKSFLLVGTEERVLETNEGVCVYSPMPLVSGSCPDREECLASSCSKDNTCDVKGSKRIRLSSLRSVSSATALSLKAGTPRRGSGPESSSLHNNETCLSPSNNSGDNDTGIWMEERQQHETRLQQQLSLIHEATAKQEEEEEEVIMVVSDGKFDH